MHFSQNLFYLTIFLSLPSAVPPVITIPPQDAAVELGRNVQFSCFASGVPAPTIQWTRYIFIYPFSDALCVYSIF